MDVPGAYFVEDIGYIGLESVKVSPGGKVACAIDIRHGATKTIEALHVDPLLYDLVAHLLAGDGAMGLGDALPGEVLEEHRRRLANVVVPSTQEPAQHEIVLLLHVHDSVDQQVDCCCPHIRYMFSLQRHFHSIVILS